MLTPRRIVDSVAGFLEEAFLGEKVYRNQVPEGFKRPSRLVEVPSLRIAAQNYLSVAMVSTVRVTGFTPVDTVRKNSDANELSNAMTQTYLALYGKDPRTSGALEVEDRHLHISGTDLDVGLDYYAVVLTLTYDDDRITPEDLPPMETVSLNMTVNEEE